MRQSREFSGSGTEYLSAYAPWGLVRARTWVTLVAATLLVTACGTPGGSNASSQPSAQASGSQATASQASDEPSGPSGSIIIAQGFDPRSLFANSSTAQQEINISEQINEKLIEFSVDATEYEPRLATGWEQVDDVTTHLFLRKGVTFTNGEPFNAESAKFSLDVWLNAESYVGFTTVIDHAEIVDEYTVAIVTKTPTLLHMPALAMGSFQYPKSYFEQVGEDQFAVSPIGTGPYVLDHWNRGSEVVLKANRDYWNGPPAIETVTFRSIPEGAARLAALEAGDVDFIIDVPLDAVERLEAQPETALFSRPSNRMFYVTLSTIRDTPLRDPKVRKAMWYAIDVQGIIDSLFLGRGTQLKGQVLGPSYFGFDPDREATPYDPDLARQMLAEAGYPDGFEVTFPYPSGRYAQDTEIGQAIAAQLEQVGIRTQQEVLESGTWLDRLITKDLNDFTFAGSLPPPDAHFMYSQFQSDFYYAYHGNKEVDKLLEQGATSVDPDERRAVYREIMDIMEFDDPFYVPLFQPEEFYAAVTGLAGFEPRASQFLDVRAWSLP